MSSKKLRLVVVGEYVELCNALKLAGIAGSGGEGKAMVADGLVRVDGQPELRKKAKLRLGQKISCLGHEIVLVAE